jgi:hypothetical protein
MVHVLPLVMLKATTILMMMQAHANTKLIAQLLRVLKQMVHAQLTEMIAMELEQIQTIIILIPMIAESVS